MKCVICKHGVTKLARVTVTLEKGGATIILKSVPAEVCQNCGEQYIDAETSAKLMKEAQEAARVGVEVEVRTYVAA